MTGEGLDGDTKYVILSLNNQEFYKQKHIMKKITEHAAWQALQAHQTLIAKQHMQDWFAIDKNRFSRFSLQVNELLLDYSKNLILQETLPLLSHLADITGLASKIDALFSGHPVNTTEKRAALHTALRNRSNKAIFVNGNDIMPGIRAELEKMRHFSEQVRNQEWRGITNKPIRDIVNIGIGGSHLGPWMAIQALAEFASDKLRCHFISNIDSAHIQAVLNQIDPETTLFIISSKSFTTLETTTNAHTVRKWVENKIGPEAIHKHFVAITAAKNQALQFGIAEKNIFLLWEWVGGRYSIWSAIGLPLAIMIGMERFLEFLNGGYAMDEHFRHADFSANMPVLMALLGIWYINFFAANNHAIVVYSHHLNYFRHYLQQTDMESSGKSITHRGLATDYATGPIIWGEQGCDGQHAFHQLLHQGKHFIPVDFILAGANNQNFESHHDILIASALSQAKALMQGKTHAEALAELQNEEYSKEEAHHLAWHKSIPGNRPSNTLFLNKITPYNLGALIALYEHKVFVQSTIWDINPFDQWGVELGKQLLPKIFTDLKSTQIDPTHDSSTQGLICHYKNLRNGL